MSEITLRYQRDSLALRNAVVAALLRVWPALDPERLDETFPGWAAAVAQIVASGRRGAAGIASEYVRQLRASQGLPGEIPPVQPRGLPVGVLASSLGVTGPVAIKKAMTRGVPIAKAVEDAFVLSTASATRHVLDAGREYVIEASAQDRRAVGWRWVSDGRPCKWCDQFAGQEFPATREFKSHDGCGCSAEPVYR